MLLPELQAAFLKLLGAPGAVEPPPAPNPLAPTAAATPGTPTAAAPPTPAPALTAPPSPVQLTDFKGKGYHLDVKVPAAQVVGAADLLNHNGFAIDTVTGVDWMAAGELEIVYDFFHLTRPLHVVIRTRVPRTNPELPTISRVFAGANWHERETHEFLGIRFLGHPNLTPLILPEDATYHPLRKDFTCAA